MFNRIDAFWLGILIGVIGFGVVTTFIYVVTKIVLGIAVVLLLVYAFGKLITHALKRSPR